VRSGKYRFLRTSPLIFSPVDPHVLYLGANVLFRTTNGGHSWDILSPDLSREKPEVPESCTPNLSTLRFMSCPVRAAMRHRSMPAAGCMPMTKVRMSWRLKCAAMSHWDFRR
jgi:hypothetical protein